MDYAKVEIKARIEEILNRIDDSGSQSDEITVDSQLALIHDDLLQHIYCELEQMINDIDMVGLEEDEEFIPNPTEILKCKESLIISGYDFHNTEVFTAEPFEYDENRLACVHYLERCGYHFIGFDDLDD